MLRLTLETSQAWRTTRLDDGGEMRPKKIVSTLDNALIFPKADVGSKEVRIGARYQLVIDEYPDSHSEPC